MTGGLLVRSAVTITYKAVAVSKLTLWGKPYTYGNRLHLTNLLDPVACCGGLETFEHRLDLGLREQSLLGGLWRVALSVTAKDDLIFFRIVFVEQGLLVVNRPRSHLHLERVLLRVLLDLAQVLIITVLNEPGNNVALRPVDLQRVLVLVVDVVLIRGVSLYARI